MPLSISLWFLIFSILYWVQAYHWDGNTMYDLEYQGTDFQAEAISWTSSEPLVTSGVLTTQCGSNTLLGGYNIMGGSSYYFGTWSKTFTSLPAHNTIFFKGKFYMIDQWAITDDHFHLDFDSYDIIMWWIYSNYAYATANKCGNPSYNDLDPMMIYFTIPHTASSLTFSIANHFTQTSDKQSVGIRDITMTFSMDNSLPFSYCGVTGGYPLNSNICACGAGTTMNPANSGLCTGCDPSCGTCNGAGPSKCTSCTTGFYLASDSSCSSCDSTCLSCNGAGRTVCTSCSSPLVLAKGSCCDASCATCSGTGPNECSSCVDGEYLSGGSCYPCDSACKACNAGSSSDCTSCADGEYLDNGTCSPCDGSCKKCNGAGSSACTACDPSKFLVSGACTGCDPSCLTCTSAGPKVCSSCPPNKYLSGTSCYDTCDSPLVKSSSGGIDYCKTPCVGSYALLEGGCSAACDSPRTKFKVNGFDVCGFPCADTSIFYYWNGSCINNCPSPLSQSNVGGQNYCKFPCSSGSDYLYWDGTCKSSCPSPYLSETQGTNLQRNLCWFPCQAGKYLYWNGSCLPTCSYPLKYTVDTTGARFCSNPCGTSGNYLFSNQSCLSTCPSPLTIIENPGVQYCFSPCSSSGSFLYENKTCIGNCLSPFVKRFEPNAQFCDRPCDPGLFWYKNTSCIPDCKAPYVQIIYSGVLQCLPPCPDSEFFYEFEKECHPQCESPFKIKYFDVIKICYNDIQISLAETTKVQGAAASIQSQGAMASGGMKAAGAMNSGSPSSALLAGLSSMLQYIRYMKINYPPKVEMLFLVSAGSPISLGFDFNIPTSIAKKLDDRKLPDVFEKYNINSNFVNNLWDFLMTLLMILIVIGGLWILKFVVSSKKFPRIHLILSKILGAMKWNVPIMMVCSSSGDIFFYASLQIRTSHLNSLSAIICFCVSILMMIVVLAILAIGLKILRNFRRQAENPNWAKKWKGYEILYEEYEEKSIWSLSYMILFIIRGIIFNFTLANLFHFPLIQCIIINVTNLLMLGYLLYLRPLKNFLNLVQLFVNEGLVNIIGVSIIILAIMDKAGIKGESTRVSVGDAIYFVIKVFNTFGLVFMGLGLLVFLISLYKIWRHMKAQKINSPMKIFKAMILGEVKKEGNSLEASEVLKRTRIRKPPRTYTNQTQTNEVIYIGETEMSGVQMITDISRSDVLSGINTTLTPNGLRTDENLQITELEPGLQLFSMKKSEIIMMNLSHQGETLRETLETEAGASEIETKKNLGFLRNWRKFKGQMKPKEQITNHNQGVSAERSPMEERIETGGSEIQNDDEKNKSVELIQDWRRLKGRLKSRGTTNLSSFCQEQGTFEINQKGEIGISEIGVTENPHNNHNIQKKNVGFIQNWGRFKGRMKSREPVSLRQEEKAQALELSEKEEKTDTKSEITKILENIQDKKSLGLLQAWENLRLSPTKNG